MATAELKKKQKKKKKLVFWLYKAPHKVLTTLQMYV